MSAISGVKTTNKGKHRFIIEAGEDGEFVFSVSPGRRVNINIGNPAGTAFDHIFYNFSEAEDDHDKTTRVQGLVQAGITDINYSAASLVGMQEVGINIPIASASDITIEVLESKL